MLSKKTTIKNIKSTRRRSSPKAKTTETLVAQISHTPSRNNSTFFATLLVGVLVFSFFSVASAQSILARQAPQCEGFMQCTGLFFNNLWSTLTGSPIASSNAQFGDPTSGFEQGTIPIPPGDAGSIERAALGGVTTTEDTLQQLQVEEIHTPSDGPTAGPGGREKHDLILQPNMDNVGIGGPPGNYNLNVFGWQGIYADKYTGSSLNITGMANVGTLIAQYSIKTPMLCLGSSSVCPTSVEEFGPWKKVSDTTKKDIYFSEGNVGIGTATPQEKLQIGDSLTLHDGGWKGMRRNVRYYEDPSGTSHDVRMVQGPAADIMINDTGDVVFRTAANGSVGSNVDWVNGWKAGSMIIKNDGKVGISTATPMEKLSVLGNVKIFSTNESTKSHQLINEGMSLSRPISNQEHCSCDIDDNSRDCPGKFVATRNPLSNQLESACYDQYVRLLSPGEKADQDAAKAEAQAKGESFFPAFNKTIYDQYEQLPDNNFYVDGHIGIGTMATLRPLAIKARGDWQELMSFQDTQGMTRWHVNMFNNADKKDGLNFAESGVADNRLFLARGGNVGIGTASPGASLQIANTTRGIVIPAKLTCGQQNEVNGFDVSAILFQFDPAGGCGDFAYIAYKAKVAATDRTVLRIKTGNDGFGSGAEDDIALMPSGYVGINTEDPQFTLDVKGDINVRVASSGNTVADNNKLKLALSKERIGFDVAELFDTEEKVEVGDVLVVGTTERKLRKSSKPYQDAVVGVVSGAPAILFEGSQLKMGTSEKGSDHDRKPAVALTGKVPVKVSLENGPIHIGDYLTTSSKSGIAMKAIKQGMTIGVALEGYSGKGKNEVLTFLSIKESNTSEALKELSDRLEKVEKNIKKK